MAAGKPIRLLRDGAVLSGAAFTALTLTLFFPCLFLVLAQVLSRIPSASDLQAIGVALLAALLYAVPGIWMHEASHYVAFRAFGLRARFTRWVAAVPLGVRTGGIVPRRAYLWSLVMPTLAGVTLAAPVIVSFLMGASLSLAAASLGFVGAFMVFGASDDLGRVFVILRRPEWPAFEEDESGGAFRPVGHREWLTVTPFRAAGEWTSKAIYALLIVFVLLLGLNIPALLF